MKSTMRLVFLSILAGIALSEDVVCPALNNVEAKVGPMAFTLAGKADCSMLDIKGALALDLGENGTLNLGNFEVGYHIDVCNLKVMLVLTGTGEMKFSAIDDLIKEINGIVPKMIPDIEPSFTIDASQTIDLTKTDGVITAIPLYPVFAITGTGYHANLWTTMNVRTTFSDAAKTGIKFEMGIDINSDVAAGCVGSSCGHRWDIRKDYISKYIKLVPAIPWDEQLGIKIFPIPGVNIPDVIPMFPDLDRTKCAPVKTVAEVKAIITETKTTAAAAATAGGAAAHMIGKCVDEKGDLVTDENSFDVKKADCVSPYIWQEHEAGVTKGPFTSENPDIHMSDSGQCTKPTGKCYTAEEEYTDKTACLAARSAEVEKHLDPTLSWVEVCYAGVTEDGKIITGDDDVTEMTVLTEDETVTEGEPVTYTGLDCNKESCEAFEGEYTPGCKDDDSCGPPIGLFIGLGIGILALGCVLVGICQCKKQERLCFKPKDEAYITMDGDVSGPDGRRGLMQGIDQDASGTVNHIS